MVDLTIEALSKKEFGADPICAPRYSRITKLHPVAKESRLGQPWA